MTANLAFFSGLGPWEIIIILVLALLIFGRRLPEVGRSLGKGIVEFKKGLKGIEDEVNTAGDDDEDEAPKSKKRLEDKSTETVDTSKTESRQEQT